MPPKRKMSTNPALPNNIEETSPNITTSVCLRTKHIYLIADIFDIPVSFLLSRFCSCLNQKISKAFSTYSFLMQYNWQDLIQWFKESYEVMQAQQHIFPPPEMLLTIPNLQAKDIALMRAMIVIRYIKLEVSLLFFFG